jgi:hypothetical protein
MDWKSMVADYKLGSDGEGETIGDFVEESAEPAESAEEPAVADEAADTAESQTTDEGTEEAA